MVTSEEQLDLLNRLSPEELAVFVYKYLFDLTEAQISDCRWRFKLSPLDCHRAINRMYYKRKKLDVQNEQIAAFQELFNDKLGSGFFISDR